MKDLMRTCLAFEKWMLSDHELDVIWHEAGNCPSLIQEPALRPHVPHLPISSLIYSTMSTVPALQAALNNANAQLTESNARIAALSATLGKKNRYLIAASRELYAPTTVRGVYSSLEPMSFIGETQIVRQVPGETLEHVRYEELWSSSSPQVNPYNVEHNMYGHYGTRVPGLFISHEEVERWVVIWYTVGEKRTCVTFQ